AHARRRQSRESYGGSCCVAITTTPAEAGALGISKRRPPGFRAPVGESAPAPVDHEHRGTTLIDPDAGAVPAPVATFDAARVGDTLLDAHRAATSGINPAHAVAIILAF